MVDRIVAVFSICAGEGTVFVQNIRLIKEELFQEGIMGCGFAFDCSLFEGYCTGQLHLLHESTSENNFKPPVEVCFQ
jgi:hypothetical protein